MKKILLVTFLFLVKCGVCQYSFDKPNPNISKELGVILKKHEGVWKSLDDGENTYFINIQINNGYIIWRTVNDQNGMMAMNDCRNDSLINDVLSKDVLLKDTATLSIQGIMEKLKAYRKIVFSSEDNNCEQKASTLNFSSACFWEPKIKIEMVFYCNNKLLLIIKDTKEEQSFWFQKTKT